VKISENSRPPGWNQYPQIKKQKFSSIYCKVRWSLECSFLPFKSESVKRHAPVTKLSFKLICNWIVYEEIPLWHVIETCNIRFKYWALREILFLLWNPSMKFRWDLYPHVISMFLDESLESFPNKAHSSPWQRYFDSSVRQKSNCLILSGVL
jgi:hypothetical protein